MNLSSASSDRWIFGHSVDTAMVLLTLMGITAVGLVARVPLVGDSIFMDELSTFFLVQQDFAGMVTQISSPVPQEWTPPLYFALAWLFAKASLDPWMIRIPSLIAGVLIIPLTFQLGKMTIGRKVGLVGSALVALSPLMVIYSTEARAYALVTFIVLCSTITLLVAIDRGSAAWWGLYALLLAAAMYTHYTAVFVLLGQTAWGFFASPASRRPILLSVLFAILLWAPWIGGLASDALNPRLDVIGVAHPFGPRMALGDIAQAVIGVGLPATTPLLPGSLPVVLLAAGILISLLGLARLKSRSLSSGVILILVLAVAAPTGAAISSYLGPDTFLPRTLMTSFPGFALTIAALVLSQRVGIASLATTLVLGSFLLAVKATLSQENRRSDMAKVLDFVDRKGSDQDPVVDCSAPAGVSPWQSLDVEVWPDSKRRRSQPIFRLCWPTFKALAEARRPETFEESSSDRTIPITPPGRVATQAVESAINNRIFLVVMGENYLPLRAGNYSIVARFLKALPHGYIVKSSQVQKSISGFGPTVYEITLPKRDRSR